MVNASLLLTPGGAKFVRFLAEFSLFVIYSSVLDLKKKKKDVKPLFEASTANSNSIKVLKCMARANIEAAKEAKKRADQIRFKN